MQPPSSAEHFECSQLGIDCDTAEVVWQLFPDPLSSAPEPASAQRPAKKTPSSNSDIFEFVNQVVKPSLHAKKSVELEHDDSQESSLQALGVGLSQADEGSPWASPFDVASPPSKLSSAGPTGPAWCGFSPISFTVMAGAVMETPLPLDLSPSLPTGMEA